jgi:hypothetical protein
MGLMPTTLRHDPTPDCNGVPRPTINLGPGTRPFGHARCPECEQDLCPCEQAYGHDCEA